MEVAPGESTFTRMPLGKTLDTAADFTNAIFSIFALISDRSAFQTPDFSVELATILDISSFAARSTPWTSIDLTSKKVEAVTLW